jgi:hypothetical protein
MPLPEDLEGTTWTRKIARATFPWLIWLAKNHRTVFYSELDQEIVRRRIGMAGRSRAAAWRRIGRAAREGVNKDKSQVFRLQPTCYWRTLPSWPRVSAQ